MHSLESIRVMNERAVMRGSEQRWDGEVLRNAKTGEQQCGRVFMTAESAADYCKFLGAVFVP